MSDFEKNLKIAEVWANLDGCEGGDLLRALIGVGQMAHYSYADEKALQAGLMALIDAEIGEMVHMAYGPDAEHYGFDPESVAEADKAIQQIEREAKNGAHDS